MVLVAEPAKPRRNRGRGRGNRVGRGRGARGRGNRVGRGRGARGRDRGGRVGRPARQHVANNINLREILLVVLTKRSQLYIFSKRYQKFCKTYQYLKVDGTKYATNFFL